MKNLITALFVLAFAATSAHAQSHTRRCIECDSVAASPGNIPLSSAGAFAIGHGLYGSGWNSVASGADADGLWKLPVSGTESGGVNAASIPSAPANPMIKIERRQSTLGR